MKHALTLLIALCTAVPAYAQSVDAALDGIIKDAKSNFEQLQGLDKSDKAIKISNDAQIFSTQAANKAEKEVKDATPALQMDANRADQMRNQLLAMGCPEGGGVVSIELAQRCNPLIAQHKAFSATVLRKADELKTKMKMVNTLRASITKTTLENVEKQKKNNEARAKLMSQKLEIKTRAVMAGLRNKVAAEKACKSLPTDESQVCCHKAVFDGLDPKSCGLDIMCQVFEHHVPSLRARRYVRKQFHRLPINREQMSRTGDKACDQHACRSAARPLSAAKWTCLGHHRMSAYDPEWKLASLIVSRFWAA